MMHCLNDITLSMHNRSFMFISKFPNFIGTKTKNAIFSVAKAYAVLYVFMKLLEKGILLCLSYYLGFLFNFPVKFVKAGRTSLLDYFYYKLDKKEGRTVKNIDD